MNGGSGGGEGGGKEAKREAKISSEKRRNEGFGIELITRVGTLWMKGARNREKKEKRR